MSDERVSEELPVKRRFKPRRGVVGITPAIAEAFLAAVSDGAADDEAADFAGTTPNAIRRKRETDEVFARHYDDARADRNARAEAELRRRAIDGWEEPVFYRGEVVGHKLVKSDRALEFMLKAEMPDKYGDRIVQEVLVVPMTGSDVARARAIGQQAGAAELLEQVAALFAAEAERKELAAGEVIEGEVVE